MEPIFLFLNKEFEEKEGSERFLSECQIIGRREDTTKNLVSYYILIKGWADFVELVSVTGREIDILWGRSCFVDRIQLDAEEASEIEAWGRAVTRREFAS